MIVLPLRVRSSVFEKIIKTELEYGFLYKKAVEISTAYQFTARI